MRTLISVAAALFCMIHAAHSSEETTRQCEHPGEMQISGCTALIESSETKRDYLAIAFYNRGNGYQHKGQFERAIKDYDDAIRLDPSYARAFENRGIAYGNLREYDIAIRNLDQAIELDPRLARAIYFRGLAKDYSGDVEGSKIDFERARALDPEVESTRWR